MYHLPHKVGHRKLDTSGMEIVLRSSGRIGHISERGKLGGR